MKQYLYGEDNQMYFTVFVPFETDSELSIKEMEEISMGNGRLSFSFSEFVKAMKKRGDIVRPIQLSPKELSSREVVFGGTGNY